MSDVARNAARREWWILPDGQTVDFVPQHFQSIHVREVLEGDQKLLEDARELCALMAEGEGSDERVYMSMAKQAMQKLDQLLPEGPLATETENP